MSHMIIKRIKMMKDGSIKIKWSANNVYPLDFTESTVKKRWKSEPNNVWIEALDWLAEGIRTEFELRKGVQHSKLGRACYRLYQETPLWRIEQHPKIIKDGKETLDYDNYFVTENHPLVKKGEEYDRERADELNELDKNRYASLLRKFIAEEEKK